MNRCGAILLLLILAAGELRAQVDPESGPYAVSGVLGISQSGNEEIEIRLLDDANMVVARVLKRPHDHFTFGGLSRGLYFLSVNVSGYKPLQQRVEFLGGRREVNVPVMMEPQQEIVIFERPDLFGDKDAVVSVTELSQPEAVLKDYEETARKIQAGKIDDAQRRLEAMVLEAPGFYLAHQSLAEIYQENRRYEDAEKEYQTARKLQPSSAAPWIGLSSLYLQQIDAGITDSAQAERMLNDAKESLFFALKLNPDAAFAHYLLGVAYYKASLYNEAENSLVRALELEPRLGSVRLALANIHIRTQDWPRALTQLDAYLKGNPHGSDRDQVLATRSRIEMIAGIK